MMVDLVGERGREKRLPIRAPRRCDMLMKPRLGAGKSNSASVDCRIEFSTFIDGMIGKLHSHSISDNHGKKSDISQNTNGSACLSRIRQGNGCE